MFDSQVVAAIVAALGGIIATYLTVKYKDRVIKKNQDKAPKDRMDTIFDGYESLIKQQQSDIERKSRQLDATQNIIEKLQQELDHTRELVRQQQVELEDSRTANKSLIEQLNAMKEHYGSNTITK